MPEPLIEPPPLTTLHVGVTGTCAPLLSRPTTENAAVAPACTIARAGMTTSVESAPGWIVTVALPETAPEVAVTAALYVPGVIDAVKVPPCVMVPAAAFAAQVIGALTRFPFASRPWAVKVVLPPGASVAVAGLTEIVASGPGVTVTLTVACAVPDEARTVEAKVPLTVPAVKSPPAVMVPPPFTTDQVMGAPGIAWPLALSAVAVNCCVPPTASEAPCGVMVIDATVPPVPPVMVTPVFPTTALVAPGVEAVTDMGNVPFVMPAVKMPVCAIIEPGAVVAQVIGAPVTVFPQPSAAVAAKSWVVPAGTVGFAGARLTAATSPGPTVMLVLALMAPDEAVRALPYSCRVQPAVKRPCGVMVPAWLLTDQVIAAPAIALLQLSRTTPVNCWVPWDFTVGALGVIAMLFGGPTTTFTLVRPTVPFGAVAETPFTTRPGVQVAVSCPPEVMVPAVEAHVNVVGTGLLLASSAVAMNAWVAPAATVGLSGSTTTVAMAPTVKGKAPWSMGAPLATAPTRPAPMLGDVEVSVSSRAIALVKSGFADCEPVVVMTFE